MSTLNFGKNLYNGEVLEDLLLYTAQGNDTAKNNLIHIKAGIQNKYTLPSMMLGDIIQDNKATPTSNEGKAGDGGKNTYTFSERYLEPQDFMVYMEFNPRDFEKYYKFTQPTGELVFRELDPKIQATMLRALMDNKNEYIGNAIWTSAKGGASAAKITVPEGATKIGEGSEKYFNGVIKRIVDNIATKDEAEKAAGQVVLAGDTQLKTGEDVEKALYAMWRKCPKSIRGSADLKFVIGWDAFDLYDQYLSDKDNRYSDNTEVNQYRFKGKRILPIVGIPEDTIVLGKFNATQGSNLWMGVDYTTDQEAIRIDRLQNNSELFFFQMRMKMDVNIVRPAEIVVHTAYKSSEE